MQGIAGAVFSSFNGGVENEFTSRIGESGYITAASIAYSSCVCPSPFRPPFPEGHFLTSGWLAVPCNRPIRSLERPDYVSIRLKHNGFDLATLMGIYSLSERRRIGKAQCKSAPMLGTYHLPLYLGTISLILCPRSVFIPVSPSPSAFNDLECEALQAQLLTAPPYVARCICTVAVYIIPDK